MISPLVPGLSIHDTSSQADTLPGYNFSIKPDCTVYRKEDQNVTGTVSRLAEFFVEFRSSTEDDPFIAPPVATEPIGSNDPEHFLTHHTPRRRHVLGQLGTYAAIHIDSQYRTHPLLVLIINNYARLMRWDRSGVIFTEAIYYNEQQEFLEFFEYSTNRANPEVRGSDLTLEKPTHDELYAASQTCPGFADVSETFLVISLHNEVCHPKPHRYIIPSPYVRHSLPVGRCTRTSTAYDIQENKHVYMKAF